MELTHTLFILSIKQIGLPRWFSGRESTCNAGRCGFDPWVRKIPWRRKWQPTAVFLPGDSCGQRSLVSYSPWGHRVMFNLTTKQQQTHTQGLGGCVCRIANSIPLEQAHGKGAGRLIIIAITYQKALQAFSSRPLWNSIQFFFIWI